MIMIIDNKLMAGSVHVVAVKDFEINDKKNLQEEMLHLEIGTQFDKLAQIVLPTRLKSASSS